MLLLLTLPQARDLGAAAERIHDSWPLRMQAGIQHADMAALRKVLRQVDEVEKAVRGDEEAAEMLQVLSAALGVQDGRPENAINYLQGHLYR